MGNENGKLRVVSGFPWLSAMNSYKDGQMCIFLIRGGRCKSPKAETGL